MRRMLVPIVAAAALAGCSRAATVESTLPSPSVQPAPATPATAAALPTGTMLTVRMNDAISTESSKVGDRFTATVTQPVVAQNGETAVPSGAVVTGTVTGLDDSDHPGDRALIRLSFDQLSFSGESHPLAADIASAQLNVGDRTVEAKRGALTGAAAGAVAAAVLEGVDLADILKGGALGAGAGAVIGVLSGDVEARIPAGSPMTLQTTQTVSLR